MANVFNSVKGLHPKRNSFSAHTYRNDFTSQLGVNIPVYIQEVPPATRVKVAASALVRLQALIAPVMDNIDYYVHFWQIPYRLLENDRFTAFISGEKEASEYDALFCTPFELANSIWLLLEDNTFAKKKAHYERLVGNGSLLDFCGYDISLFPEPLSETEGVADWDGGNNTQDVNFRALIAYFMLHVQWYMNENVPYYEDFVEDVDNLVKNQGYGTLAKLIVKAGDFSQYGMLPHGWDKDYFTSGLPNVQFGDPVTLPLGGSAPVSQNPAAYSIDFTGTNSIGQSSGIAGNPSNTSQLYMHQGKLQAGYYDEDQSQWVFTPIENLLGNESSLNIFSGGIEAADEDDHPVPPFLADLTEATAITINELRFANALQVFKERQMRFGRRRLEYYKGFFDVTPEDLRLQVPKYLGGGRIPINISDIEQTSATSGTDALGHLAGKATAVAGGFAGFSTFCSEESIIIGIAFAMPHITYAQSLSRFKLKTNDIYDYFNPCFEHLGEQAILNVEVYSGSNQPAKEFAYTPRYNEYRFHNNEMHGQFKSSLSFWTLGRIFDSTPALNADFVYMQPSVFDRIFAVANQPSMLVSMLFRTRIVQPVSKYGTPMLLA